MSFNLDFGQPLRRFQQINCLAIIPDYSMYGVSSKSAEVSFYSFVLIKESGEIVRADPYLKLDFTEFFTRRMHKALALKKISLQKAVETLYALLKRKPPNELKIVSFCGQLNHKNIKADDKVFSSYEASFDSTTDRYCVQWN